VFYFVLLFTFRTIETNWSLIDQEETRQSQAEPWNEPIATKWWNETRQRLESIALRFPSSRQTVYRLLSDPAAFELVLEPYLDLEPRLAVQFALNRLLAS
jgi:hypothetical protein